MNNPKVSVIIPVYNVEKYLKECLDSVINQTLKEIEIICIDDGSTDNSLKILQEYAAQDERIIVLQQENKGAGYSRNKGIEIAKGKFVIFLDSDDYYQYPDNLEILYQNAITHNVKICGGSFLHLFNNTIRENSKGSLYGYKFEKNEIIEYKDWQFDYGYHRFLYEREFLIKNKIAYPNYKRFQDPPFFVKAMYKAGSFYALSRPTYLLRVDHKSVNWSKEKQRDLLMGLTDNFNFAKKHKLNRLYYNTAERLNQHHVAFNFLKLDKEIRLQLKTLISGLDMNIILSINPDFVLKDNYQTSIYKKIIRTIFSIKNKKDRITITLFGLKIKRRKK